MADLSMMIARGRPTMILWLFLAFQVCCTVSHVPCQQCPEVHGVYICTNIATTCVRLIGLHNTNGLAVREIRLFRCSTKIVGWEGQSLPVIRDRHGKICNHKNRTTGRIRTTPRGQTTPPVTTTGRIQTRTTGRIRTTPRGQTTPPVTTTGRIQTRTTGRIRTTPRGQTTPPVTTTGRIQTRTTGRIRTTPRGQTTPPVTTTGRIQTRTTGRIRTTPRGQTTPPVTTTGRIQTRTTGRIRTTPQGQTTPPVTTTGRIQPTTDDDDDDDDDVFGDPETQGFLGWAAATTVIIIFLIIKRLLRNRCRHTPPYNYQNPVFTPSTSPSSVELHTLSSPRDTSPDVPTPSTSTSYRTLIISPETPEIETPVASHTRSKTIKKLSFVTSL